MTDKQSEYLFRSQCKQAMEGVVEEILDLAREGNLRADYHGDVGFRFHEEAPGEIHEVGHFPQDAITFLKGYNTGREREGHE